MQTTLDLYQTKAAGVMDAPATALKNTNKKPYDNTIPKKWQRVLAALLTGQSFNRFESERQLNDHCLHTTVAYLEGRGVTVFREFETVSGWQNLPTRVCRYWLDCSDANLKRAKTLMNRRSEEEAI